MSFPYPYAGPIALGNNYPIHSDYYQPRVFFIKNITLGRTTLVKTTVDHDYVIAQLCRLIIPPLNGCRQLDEVEGMVIEIPSPSEVVLNIDTSRNVDQFRNSTAKTQPQILAIGDYNEGAINPNGRSNTSTIIPGSFINISPG
jgi:hypothetical protein